MTQLSTSACILAGGRGRRVGGCDKGLLELDGRPMVAYCAERLRPQVDQLLISANRNQEHYRAYADLVIADACGNFAGPLAGLLSAMRATEAAQIIIAPCDSPGLPLDLVARLTQAMASEQTDIAVAQADGRVQPVFACVRRKLAPSLHDYLSAEGRKITAWYDQHSCCKVAFDDASAFININTEDELRAARRQWSAHD